MKEPGLKFCGWDEYQWATVQKEFDPALTISQFIKIKYAWMQKYNHDPEQSEEENPELTMLIMSLSHVFINDSSDSNVTALDAAHKKQTTLEVSKSHKSGCGNSGSYLMGLAIGLSI